MKRKLTRLLAVVLSAVLCLQMSELSIFAMEAGYDPASQISLTVPETLQDGNNYFFIREASFSISEKSPDQLYIPVQRTGNTDAEADVSLKVADITAHYGVNYTAKIYDEKNDPEIINNGIAVVDIMQNADSQEEVEDPDPNELGQALADSGGADMVDTAGNTVGRLTAQPVDESGNPVLQESSGDPASDGNDVAMQPVEKESAAAAADSAEQASADTPEADNSGGKPDEAVLDENAPASPQALKLARDQFTGTVSDRQEMEGSDEFLPGVSAADGTENAETMEDEAQAQADLVEESYPGREYRLHFEAGETAKYLVIDPKYSKAADGDCTVMLILKDEPEDYLISGDFNTRGVNIVDEDEPEEVVISMAFPEVTAENGEASIKVTREGAINNVAGVMVSSCDGSAVMGDDYGGVGAKLYFPMGITERTVELPVGHGSEQKDFNVTITPLNGETIGIETTHVVIPPAAADEQDATLQADVEVGDAWNLKNRKSQATGGVSFPSEYTVKMVTDDDKCQTQYLSFHTENDYAWDGVHVDYDIYTWYAMVKFQVEKWENGKWNNLYTRDHGDLDEEWANNQSADVYFGSERAPYTISVDDRCYEVHNGFRDSETKLSVKDVQPIKRQFTVNMDKAEPLAFEGVSDSEEASRVSVMMDDKIKSQVKLWTGDNFSVSKPIGQTFTRLTDVVAVTENGRTYSIKDYMTSASDSGYSYSAGMSDTFVIELTPALINYLANRDCIKWSRAKSGSYSGTIHFRPVFGYTGNVTVSVRDTAEGKLQMNGREFQDKTYHLGDQLTFTPKLGSEGVKAGMRPCGVGYVSRSGGASGKLIWRSECDFFVDEKVTYELTTDYYEFWQVFTEEKNMVQVQVPTEQLQYFNTDAGLFRDALSQEVAGTYTVFTMKKDVLTNELTELWAYSKDDSGVPVWVLGSGRTRYSGNAFYYYTDATAAENLITLTMDRTVDNHSVYSLTGSICSMVMNISTGLPSEELIPSGNASVLMGNAGIVTDENGDFTLEPQKLVGDTTVRYLVSYNGIVSLKEARLAPATAAMQEMTYLDGTGKTVTAKGIPVTLGVVQIDSYSPGSAHFSRVAVEQEGILNGVINVLELNGKKLTVKVYVDPGQKYIFDGQEYTEEIKDVTLYFQNQLTGEIHGTYSTGAAPEEQAKEGTEEEQQSKKDKTPSLEWDADNYIATLNVKKFSPDAPDEYTYGDVLVARLSTDKRTVKTELTGLNMVYDPVSTGLAVITDRDYKPETYNYNLDLPTLLNANVDDDGTLMDGEQSRNSFGKFPFLGEISSAIKVFTLFKKALRSNEEDEAEKIIDDLEDLGDGGLAEDGAELMWNPLSGKKIAMSAMLKIKETPYGGVRIMFAVVATTAIGSYDSVINPEASKNYYSHMKYGTPRPNTEGKGKSSSNGIKYLYNSGGDAADRFVKSEMSGKYARFSLYVGIYMDFGYILETRADGTKTQLSHNVVYMGAGGFIGGQVGLGNTWQMFPYGIPCYINLEGNVTATLFLGSSADPLKTLEEYNSTNNHEGSDFNFNVELLLQGSISATGGLGLYKTLGAHITLSVGLDAGYNRLMPVWYKHATDWGFTTNFTISGGIDCTFKGVNLSIDLGSASWPLPFDYGYMAFAQQARRGTILLTMLYKKIDGIKDENVKNHLWTKILIVGDAIDHYTTNEEQMERMVDDLRDEAYNYGLISWLEKQRVNMVSGTGVFFAIWDSIEFIDGWDDFWPLFKEKAPMDVKNDAELAEDDAPHVGAALLAALDEQEQQSGNLRVNAPAASDWVAGENGQLMSAFGAVSSEKLVDEAVSQPSSQIMEIDGNRFLVVYRSEIGTSAGSRSTVLMYSIYNANDGSWTDPELVQDEIGDGRPSLTDAGGKLILTWPSESQEKYDSYLKKIQEQGKTLEEAVAENPAEAAASQDIFVAEFDKSEGTFGEVEQITDDAYCDDFPQAVYDSETGDYIVLYYKTAQDIDDYDTAKDAMLDMIAASPDPDKTYSVLCYMLHNNQTEAKDTNGLTHETGWARDYLFANETDQTPEQQQVFLKLYGGQRFLPSTLREEDGGQTDEPIADLTAAPGYNSLAAFAFTVDKDYNLNSSEDRELFVQFYDFKSHSTYVPVKVAGETTKEELYLNGDRKTGHYETRDVTQQVNVGSPRLVRNEGDTWLFWREDNEGLKYLNISEMLNAKVASVANPTSEADLTWAVQEDGSFAVDAETGVAYTPDIQSVDFGSALTGNAVHITDYQVVTDQDDNLYVVWTDTTRNGEITSDKEYEANMALEIYATAKIKEADQGMKDTGAGEEKATSASWSKPYRLTRDNKYNDGVAVALSDSGDLLILHNQYEKLPIDSEETLAKLVSEGRVIVEMKDGEPYVKGSMYYDSPVSLMLTSCEPIGSVEATQFIFSDQTPEPGQTVDVTVALENTGLVTAEGCKIDFYEYKDDVRGKKIASVSDDSGILVNSAKKTSFEWTVPSEGVDGYCIKAEVSEKKTGWQGGYYESVDSFSETFEMTPDYELTLDSWKQNGDVFEMEYTVTNTGNLRAKDGTEANLYLKGLYGDLKEQYGMDDDLLVQEDISGLAPGETRTVKKSVSLPVSVFEYCGYDAVQVVVRDNEGNDLKHTDHQFITLDEPLNLTLNNGSDLSLIRGESAAAPATYDSTLFMDMGGANGTKVVYTVDDPAIAAVDENGMVTGLGKGTTNLTATLLPSGRTASVKVKVQGGESSSGGGTVAPGHKVTLPDTIAYGSASSSAKQAKAGEQVTITVTPEEDAQTVSVNVTDENGNVIELTDNGDGTYTFTMPDTAVTVTPVFTKEGDTACPRDDTCPMTPFTDADKQAWYHDGVHWAIEKGIMNGTGKDTFEPLTSTSRAMIVTMLWRMEGSPQVDDNMTFKDVSNGQWYTDAVRWAAANGIVNGYSEDAFGPDDKVTREQIVTILYRYAQFKGIDVSRGETAYLNDYTDARDIAEWAVKAFRWAVDVGIIQGMSNTILSPQVDAVRAQVATMLMRCEGVIQ